DYIRRKNAVNFFVSAGAGLVNYNPTFKTSANSAVTDFNKIKGRNTTEFYIPVGVGVKFRLTDALALNLGYTENFLDGDNLDFTYIAPSKDKWSYGYGGLEYTFGPKSKPNLDWVNP